MNHSKSDWTLSKDCFSTNNQIERMHVTKTKVARNVRTLVLGVIALLAQPRPTSAQTFVLSSTPTAGDSPYSVTAADVNGDGKLDLISANSGVNTLSVLTNSGNGSFALSSSPTVGSFPDFVAAADVNGDGKPDLISANGGTNTLSVLTNNGSGGFAPASTPGVGTYPDSVAVADINGDGKPDLICANHDGNTLSVLTNKGGGVFVLSGSPTVGTTPYSVIAADVNGDGKLDLICADYGDGKLTVLTNNGSGGFVFSSSPVAVPGPVSVAAADVNGDGKVDLISSGTGASAMVVTNDGSGGFVYSATVSAGSHPFVIIAADVNGDGKADLVAADNDVNSLTVLTNNGSGGFGVALTPLVGHGPRSVVAADVNGDGRVDLISANHDDNTLSVLLNFVARLDSTRLPRLSLTLFGPGTVEISWLTNFADWQLMTTTNLGASATWDSAGTAFPLGGVMAVFYPLTNRSRFFRLQQNGGGTDFHATPATISAGGSSTLSWRTNANTSYQLWPGIGPVTGTNYIVFPPVTTTYILVASNSITGVTSNTTTVVVTTGSCAFAGVTTLSGTLSFSYDLTPSSADVIYGIHESANVTVNLARVSAPGNLLVFTGAMGGTASVNDLREPLPNVQDTITIVGNGPPLAGQPVNLTIDCGSGTYTFDAQPIIIATWTPSGPLPARVGSVYVNNRALPATHGPLTGSGSLPARGPLWSGAGDWYFPGDLGSAMFYATVTDTTAGNATISWSFTPAP